jgi:hypothetical protein
MLRGRDSVKRLFVLLLIAGVFITQTSSVSIDNLHRHSSQHCCGLCHAGTVSPATPAATIAIAPSASVAWSAAVVEIDTECDEVARSTHPRAPPA